MKKRILITDDSKSWLMYNAELINQLYGETVEINLAQSASEAMEIINSSENNPFSLIITDLQMESDYEPLCAGEWLIEEIKKNKKYQTVPIIIISAMSTIKNTAEKYNAEYIPKNQLVNNKLLMKLATEKFI